MWGQQDCPGSLQVFRRTWWKASITWVASWQVDVGGPAGYRWLHCNSLDRDEPEEVSHSLSHPFPSCQFSFFHPLLSPCALTPTSKAMMEITKHQVFWLPYLSRTSISGSYRGTRAHSQNPVPGPVFCGALCQNDGRKNNFIKIGKTILLFLSVIVIPDKQEECDSWDWISLVILAVISNITNQTEAGT